MGAGALQWLYKEKTQNKTSENSPSSRSPCFQRSISFRPSVEAPLFVVKRGREAQLKPAALISGFWAGGTADFGM